MAERSAMAASADPGDLLALALAGDDTAFATLVRTHERPVFRHCYRMLGSGMDAEDAVQDALERAWRRLASYDGSGPFGAWLHRIATNVCLDMLRARRTRQSPAGLGPPAAPGSMPEPPDAELAWVEPVSDADLGAISDPEYAVMRREEISLAFVAALQRLAPRQRAALLLHDVLGFSHAETADVLAVSKSAVNSLLSRARETTRSSSGSPAPDLADPRVQQLLERYVRAWQLADIEGFIQLVADDIRFSMPPLSAWYDGRDAVAEFTENAIFASARPHGVTLRFGSCNGQPAFATYEPDGAGHLVATGLQILQVGLVNGEPLITALVSYRDPAIASRCGLPAIINLCGVGIGCLRQGLPTRTPPSWTSKMKCGSGSPAQ
jgi:RNA polymerase sigma-70 factor (ECF subfamily)